MNGAANKSEITWNSTDISRERIARYFGLGVERDGEKWIAWIMKDGVDAALAHCASRAAGAWDANECESYAMHRSLSILIEKGEVR